ncbi:hypothetical protein FCV25MIE_19689 [Fagus crenata]
MKAILIFYLLLASTFFISSSNAARELAGGNSENLPALPFKLSGSDANSRTMPPTSSSCKKHNEYRRNCPPKSP